MGDHGAREPKALGEVTGRSPPEAESLLSIFIQKKVKE